MPEVTLIPLNSLLTTERFDDQPIYHDGQRFVGWHEFSGKVAAQSESFKMRNESRWLLVANHPGTFLTSFFALLHAGKKVVIPPNTQGGTLALLADEFDAIADETPILQLSSSTLLPLDPSATSINLYTSGSTGKPKQICKTLAQLELEIETLEAIWGTALGQASIIASVPHHHIYGLLFRLLWPLATGRIFDTITCAHPDDIVKRLAILGKLGGCILISSPAQLSRLPALIPLRSLKPLPKMIFSSGGPLPATTALEFHRQLGQAPTEVFGSTETGGVAWRSIENKNGSDSWTPLPGIKIGRDAAGAITLMSPFLADRTPWIMDDEIEPLSDGRFHLRGRLDRTVKIEEKRLSLYDMEAQLLLHPWVLSVAALALSGRRQSIGVVIVLTKEGAKHLDTHGKRDTTKYLRKHLTQHFESVLLPRFWRFPEQLPINDSGKLTNAALVALFRAKEDDCEITHITA